MIQMKEYSSKDYVEIAISSYGILFLVLFITIILYLIDPVRNAILLITQSIFKEKAIYQSTLTSTSIMIGFTGTLITNIMNAKNRISADNKSSNGKELIEFFFHNVDSKVLTNTILTGIISGVFLMFISLVLIAVSNLNSIIYEKTYLILFMIWSAFLIIFLLYEIQIFKVFIKLLISKEKEQNPNSPTDTSEEISNCMEAIDNRNKK